MREEFTNLPPIAGAIRIKDVTILISLLLTLTLSARDWTSIETALREEMTRQNIPGAAMVIVEKGRLVVVKGFGVRSVEDPVPVNEKTLFRLGSTAKVFTALAAVELAAAGRLDLHAPVGEHPIFGGVTMHQLLTHTAGLADEAPQDGSHDESALARNVSSYGADLALAPAGKLFSYANPGYVMAGHVVERIAAKPFAEAVSELVFRPYGMTASTYRPFEAMLHPLALPHDAAGKLIRPFPDHAGAWPPGSMFSNAEDLGRFLSRGLAARLVQEKVTVEATGQQYGYGVIVEDGRVYHTGARLGYGSRFEFFPEAEVAVFFAGNRTGALFSRTAAVLRALLQKGEGGQAPADSAAAWKDDEARGLAGVYENRGPIRAELLLVEGRLHVKAGARQIAVEKTVDDWYRARGAAQLERFRILRDSAGRPEYLCAEVWCMKKR